MSSPVDVGSIVPSQRDFLQAVRTAKKGLALVPCMAEEDAAREALRMAESGVTSLAFKLPSPAMAQAGEASRLPVLSLMPVRVRDDALAARAFGADAVLVDPDAAPAERDAIAPQARSTRMVALAVGRTTAEVAAAVAKGSKAIVLEGADAKAIVALAGAAGRALTLGVSRAPLADDLATLKGVVDAVIVEVDVYGATGFERLVSELNP